MFPIIILQKEWSHFLEVLTPLHLLTNHKEEAIHLLTADLSVRSTLIQYDLLSV